jgi:hypothetical protein
MELLKFPLRLKIFWLVDTLLLAVLFSYLNIYYPCIWKWSPCTDLDPLAFAQPSKWLEGIFSGLILGWIGSLALYLKSQWEEVSKKSHE